MMMMTPASSISPGGLLADHFYGSSWDRWRAVLKAAFAEEMSAAEFDLFREVADRDPPREPVQELWCIVGRGGGKDSTASAIATVAAVGDYQKFLRAGEVASVICLACDREQAKICLRYIRGYFREDANLEALIVRETDDGLELVNRVEIIVATNSYRSLRGRTIICTILDEVAFFRDERSASPDEETYNALMPALERVPGSKLIGISTPYRKIGLLYRKWAESFGKADEDVLVVRGTSRQFNPLLSQGRIDRALKRDRAAASSEWLAEWRADVSDYIDRALVEELVDRGVRERVYERGKSCTAFSDEAGGSGSDASTLSIVHRQEDGVIVQDLMRIWWPPFNSAEVIAEKSNLLKAWRIREVTGDHWAGALPTQLYETHGIRVQPAAAKSSLYRDFLHILNSRRVHLLDEPTQVAQLCSLERRTAWGGRESIDHPQLANCHDDAANALAGSCVIAASVSPAWHISDDLLRQMATFVSPGSPEWMRRRGTY